MAIVYKKALRENPRNPQQPKKYYPQLLTMGKSVDEELIAYQVKELSALSKGDIQSVITNFLDVVRTNLYAGHSVNIRNFGIFSMSAKTEGADTKAECTAKKIKSIRINFRAAKSIRPDVNATRAEDKISFIDFDTYVKNMFGNTSLPDDSGNDDDDDVVIDPGF
ncbi:HU family DNA-binding protein [Bacteroides sp. 51]|uniref:HU family DNA-binding protein n=1 Tax=Bacteroides sp. 51 TaxID=2302938 RepID=UPI0013D8B1C5|nr:HU family DNA-binding protein [Bacteroides sp. 51]NDV83843.1 DNA-binding protein [Bacteroides sp. 51]